MIKDIPDLKVGDIVWIYRNENNRHNEPPQEHTVVKIGTKLITVCDESKYNIQTVFRKDTMKSNDSYGHLTLILDLDAWNKGRKASKLFHAIRNSFDYFNQNKYSLEQLEKIASIMGTNTKELI